ncbi:DUF2778 domain-containing protein [Aquabacter sp. CN5-332]|uniref:DUF2778 domain-containing protein n=1 Tax=Aquabacter sp. CN5-332 TaxID=3156608 RepID=UPI0032B4D9FB
MTYTAWIDDEPSYEHPIAPPARSYLRLAVAAVVGLAGVAAAAGVLAWAFSGPVSAPAFDEKTMAQRAAQLAADAASDAEIAADVEPVRATTALSILPSWLYDPSPLAGPARTKVASAPVPLPEEPERKIEILRSVPLPLANPLSAAARLQPSEESSTPLALQDPSTTIPMPRRNPLAAVGEQQQMQLAALPPADSPAVLEPAPTKPAEPQIALPAPGDKFALYDIKGQKVYMPSGEKLEAHSGYGEGFDDITHVSVRMLGPTPPNTYTLKMREKLFHGVEALRMTPAGDGKMYGRDGFLTHSYLMGARGDSNGCISFKDYDKFLAAYKRGEVNRIVVVASLPNAPGPDNPLLAWLAGNASR